MMGIYIRLLLHVVKVTGRPNVTCNFLQNFLFSFRSSLRVSTAQYPCLVAGISCSRQVVVVQVFYG